jgi:hypothetical protein
MFLGLQTPNMVVEYSTSNCIYKIFIPDVPFDLLAYAQTSINCTTKCKWRCTQFFDHFSVNIFRKRVWLLMTSHPLDTVLVEFENHFQFKPYNIELINCTLLFDLKKKVDLDSLYDFLCTNDMSDIFKMSNLHEKKMHLYLDKQKFPALIITPNQKEKLVVEVYSSGKINATGIKNEMDKQKVVEFIENVLFQKYIALT